MSILKNDNIKLAVQKQGRLTEETLDFLWKSGLEFESSKQKLFSNCRNFPLEILFLRDNDIPKYVEEGVVDLGIIGQNLLYEKRPRVKKLLNLRFGFCSLVIAVPRDLPIYKIEDLKNMKIATSYPVSSKKYFKEKNIPIELVEISGSAEISPALGVSSAIVDLTSTGSTLLLNELREIGKIYDSEAVIIANQKNYSDNKKKILDKLLLRFKGVLSAKNYKYVMLNIPENILPKLKKVIPGLKTPIVFPLAKTGWITIGGVIKEDFFWETIERFQNIGATGIVVLPIEKIVT